jgi:hypothetical protein
MYKPSLKPIRTVEECVTPEAFNPADTAYYNVLPFSHAAKTIQVDFCDKAFADAHKFNIKALAEKDQLLFTKNAKKTEYVYTTFEESVGSVRLEIELQIQPAIARAYYTKLIRDYLSEFADVVETNYLHDCIFWFADSSQPNSGYRVYKKFGIRVQTNKNDGQPELLLSYDGISRTSIAGLSTLMQSNGFSADFLKRIVFRKACYNYLQSPEAARYHPEEVFPVLNRKLMEFLGIKIPMAPDKKKHKRYEEEITRFFLTYIDTPLFRKILPHSGKFRKVSPSEQFVIGRNSNELVFGEGKTGYDPRMGIISHGPARQPKCNKIQYFFIYEDGDNAPRERLHSYVKQDCREPGGLNKFIKQPYEFNKSLNIAFNPKEKPLETILQRISKLELRPGIAYYAFFVSPWAIWESDINKWIIYPRVKEALLQRGVMMQTLERNKLAGGALHYFMPNLAIAMTAKLGGIPWRLNKTDSNELIIGFGAFSSTRHNVRYVGASFCFNGDGSFKKFDCFRADDTAALAGSVEEAFYTYRKEHKDVKRIIIHFYKKLSKEELKPLEQMLRKLEIDIPVIVLSINKTLSKDRMVFIEKDNCGMPVAGSIFRYGVDQYLFYINDRLEYAQQNPAAMPLPLKISISANKKELLNDQQLITELMQQVYDFCFMYWRSMRHSSMPVTVAYPEMLAKIFPWFKSEALNDVGTSRPWFL